MKYYYSILNVFIALIIVTIISSCNDTTQTIPAKTVTPPVTTSDQSPTETNIPEPTSTQTQVPVVVDDWQQVWSDEFEGTDIDRAYWEFGIGPINDTLHYFTDRPENARIVDGKLQIIALEESFNGYDYTAALLKTSQSVNWRYGRIEARIKLPASNGFVPAFWMMPADDLYGWWPFSGEIDILEHPTNQVDVIYGTVHTGAFSVFTGSSHLGGTIKIPDIENEFHIYAIEWSEEKIDFFVDDQKYFAFENERSGFDTWPFDQPFYIILNMAVGGGWVGKPDPTSVFPSVLEVDYVRVFQNLNDVSIYGPDFVIENSKLISYSAPSIEGLIYEWKVPKDAQIISGQGTPEIKVNWGTSNGNIELALERVNGAIHLSYPVTVSANLLKNGSFEKGIKYWRASGLFPNAFFELTATDTYAGANAVHVAIKKPAVNAWDIQLSQSDLALESGKQYLVSLWARADGMNPKVSLAVINPNDFTLYGAQTLELSNEWMYYEMIFSVPINTVASLNIDMGESAAEFYFDNIILVTQ